MASGGKTKCPFSDSKLFQISPEDREISTTITITNKENCFTSLYFTVPYCMLLLFFKNPLEEKGIFGMFVMSLRKISYK